MAKTAEEILSSLDELHEEIKEGDYDDKSLASALDKLTHEVEALAELMAILEEQVDVISEELDGGAESPVAAAPEKKKGFFHRK